MAAKTDAEVIIGGKVYTLSGYEGEEYLQKIANYLNSRIAELEKDEGYRRLPADLKNVLIQINIADDYFKVLKQNGLMKEEAASKEKDLYDLKHELISTQIKLENSEKSLRKMTADNNESAKKLIRLETELSSLKGKQSE